MAARSALLQHKFTFTRGLPILRAVGVRYRHRQFGLAHSFPPFFIGPKLRASIRCRSWRNRHHDFSDPWTTHVCNPRASARNTALCITWHFCRTPSVARHDTQCPWCLPCIQMLCAQMTVADDFCSLNNACKISTEKVGSIGYRYRRITRQFNRDFWTTESKVAHSIFTGSYGRDTAAKGISDFDMGAVLPVALYHQYNGHAGNGQSALLQAVKRSI